MLDIMRAQDEVMADVMTLSEITAIRDFYATPDGRSAMKKLPLLMETQQPMIAGFAQQPMPAMLVEIRRIIEEP